MAKLGEDRYYQRSGDSFRVMEHFQLEDMFGRRPRPVLKVQIAPHGQNLMVSLKNEGRGAAKSLYLEMDLPSNFRPSAYGYDGNRTYWLRVGGWDGRTCRFGGDTGTILYGGQAHPVIEILATVTTPEGKPVIKGPQKFLYAVGAEDIQLQAGEIVLDLWK